MISLSLFLQKYLKRFFFCFIVVILVLFSHTFVFAPVGSENIIRKPTIMILGSYHMANPEQDAINIKADDVLVPKRLREIEQLVELLIAFKPTKIAVEREPEIDAKLQKKYRNYLKSAYQLERNEVYQIGFRVAKNMGHSKIYPVDWNKMPPVDLTALDFEAFAKANNKKSFLEEALSNAQNLAAKEEEIQKTGSIIDIHRFINLEENIHEAHKCYLTIAQMLQERH